MASVSRAATSDPCGRAHLATPDDTNDTTAPSAGPDDTATEEDQMASVSLFMHAATSGSCGQLGELLRADPTLLLRAIDSNGRTVLHAAVASRQASSVKYLLGRWGAGPALLHVTDAGGNTPLHLFSGPPEILLLLLHADTPQLDVRNVRGQTPAMTAATALGTDVASATARMDRLRAATDLQRDELALLAFLVSSPLRANRRVQSRFWWMRLHAADLAVAAAAVVIVVVIVLRPALGAALGAGALPLKLLLLHLRRRWSPNLVALLLVLAVSVLVALTLAFSLVPSLAPRHWIYLATIVPSYAHLVLCAPPALPARGATDAQLYWAAFERQRPGGAALTPDGFCTRSEAARPPRAKYSPLSQCLVPVMDHDCAYVGCAIGEGNHRSFFGFLLGASACLLVFLSRANVYIRNHPEIGIYEHRAFVVGINIDLGLLGLVLYLTYGQVWGVLMNCTTVEVERWERNNPERDAPVRGADWRSAASAWRADRPHDRGYASNALQWALARRGEAAAGSLSEAEAKAQ